MTITSQDYDTIANHELIAQVAMYYNDAKENFEFYKNINSISLQEMSKDHLMHWRKKLHELIFDGLNCHERLA